MPLYTITTQIDLLDSPAKTDLADKITAFHAEYAGVPKNWVHIVLHARRREFLTSSSRFIIRSPNGGMHIDPVSRQYRQYRF